MPELTLGSPVRFVKGVGPQMEQRLGKLGIETVSDLLFYIPHRYLDFSNTGTVSQLAAGEPISISGTVWSSSKRRTRRFKGFAEIVIADDTGTAKLLFFNQPYIAAAFKEGERVVVAGTPEERDGGVVFRNPIIRQADAGIKTVLPIYHQTQGVTSAYLSRIISAVLPLLSEVADIVPKEVRTRHNLLDLPEALKQIHVPERIEETVSARRTVGFHELFLYQLRVLTLRRSFKAEPGHALKSTAGLRRAFEGALPFTLTKGQADALVDLERDLAEPHPMNRLLLGDVGSGKTAAALFAALLAARNKKQAAFMAPTEILARQHAATAERILKPLGVSVGLLVSGSRAAVRKSIQNGTYDLVVGTHALIQEAVVFKSLAVAVVDEQHRFGVTQRAQLRTGSAPLLPHLLSMTATPIPRTLTLTLYGDLDISVIDELPKGRAPVETKIVAPHAREAVYKLIRQEIKAGRQAFVVCPLVDESDALGVKSVTAEHTKLDTVIFPELKVGLLHGKLKAKEKEAVMAAFAAGKLDVLVATPVIEVGIDVPNATIMVVENAERFGLAQLHQFRGRVGRGTAQSYFLVFTESDAAPTLERLRALKEYRSGFALAEIDLKLRGPGDLLGTKQHGVPEFKTASLFDLELLGETRQAAERLLKDDPELARYPVLRRKVESVLLSGD